MILGAFWGVAKMMLTQQQKALDEKFSANDEKFKAINTRLSTQDESDRRIEHQLNELRVEMPRDYVRREDFTRVIASFELKVDALRLTIERAMFGGKNV